MLVLDFNFSGVKISFAQHENPESLFEELLKKSDEHPDILDERIPYYADIWPSSIGLSSFISKHPELVNKKQVLEIGCGASLPGIVAAKLGGKVELTDYIKEALDLANY